MKPIIDRFQDFLLEQEADLDEAYSAFKERKSIDWDKVDSLIEEIEPIINDPWEEDESLLSELLKDIGGYSGSVMPELIRRFLCHGFNVHGNNGFNGGTCLHALCWSSYDQYILPAAELLLDAGADPFFSYKDADDPEAGILDSISWKLGYWTVGPLQSANVFSAYYAMIEAAQNGKDYHGIRDISFCLGMRLQKVEKLNKETKEQTEYVLWFSDYPVYINKDIEVFVDPLIPQENDHTPVPQFFNEVIGKTLERYYYSDALTLKLFFTDGKLLTISRRTDGNRMVTKAFISESNTAFPTDLKISRIAFDECDPSSEELAARSVYLYTNRGVLHLYRYEPVWKDVKMRVDILPEDWPEKTERHMKSESLSILKSFSDQLGQLQGLAFRVDSGYVIVYTDFDNEWRYSSDELYIKKIDSLPESFENLKDLNTTAKMNTFVAYD